MKSEDIILQHLKRNKSATGRELLELLGVSRQALNKRLRLLIQTGVLVKVGRTRGAVYRIAGRAEPPRVFRRIYATVSLEEDKVLKEADLFLRLRTKLGGNVYDIIAYALTEILNNAIEHSSSRECRVEVILDGQVCRFRVRDFGIGVFYSVFRKFNLKNEYEAIGELVKGKTTTMAKRHTGEGIFFASKVGDSVGFRSHGMKLIFDNVRKDVFVEEKRFMKGTEVTFEVSRLSGRRVETIFKEFAPEEFDFAFQKTRVLVRLFKQEYISRSEAKRLLAGLDKFQEVVLDFKGVKSIGQGFADEVFRIFSAQNPGVRINVENAVPVVASMIHHVVDNEAE